MSELFVVCGLTGHKTLPFLLIPCLTEKSEEIRAKGRVVELCFVRPETDSNTSV